jgi:heme-degrading monooxygenase HmoA
MLNGQHADWSYLIIWEFRIRPEAKEHFEQAYGPEGQWARFFKQNKGYIGTELNRDLKDPRRYVTLDFWASREAYTSFRKEHHAEYQAIDRECEELTESEVEVGSLERIGR